MRKRVIAVLLCVILVLSAVGALAASPGDTVNVVLKANSDPKGAVIAKVALDYDHAVFEVVKVIERRKPERHSRLQNQGRCCERHLPDQGYGLRSV